MNDLKSPTASIRSSAIRHEHFTSVNKTTDYSMFRTMNENRVINKMHVARLVESFKKRHLICPIIVNEKMEIIDGQHRFEAAMITSKPIFYIIVKNYGIDEVSILNTNQKNWTKEDFMTMYAEQGVEPYVQMKQFMAEFPDFGFQVSERLLSGQSKDSKHTTVGGVRMKDFQEGNFYIPDLKKSYAMARKVMDYKPYYDGFNRGVFVSALIPLFMHSKFYDHKEMIKKLSGPHKLVDCPNVESYRQLLEDIYNWKRLKENKISFKYIT